MFTPTEQRVIDQLLLGKANKQIAFEIGCKDATIKVHINNIMKKMKCNNRTQVALLLVGAIKRDESGHIVRVKTF